MELLHAIGLTDRQMLQIGLDIVGHLASAGLVLMMYASYVNRRTGKVLSGPQAVQSSALSNNPVVESHDKRRQRRHQERPDISFMRLATPEATETGTEDGSFPTENARVDYGVGAGMAGGEFESNASSIAPDSSSRFRRNRAEVIRLARKMLEAGNSPDKVADLLPLSESEMQMVRMGSGTDGRPAVRDTQ